MEDGEQREELDKEELKRVEQEIERREIKAREIALRVEELEIKLSALGDYKRLIISCEKIERIKLHEAYRIKLNMSLKKLREEYEEATSDLLRAKERLELILGEGSKE
jgi:transcriptional antiterminator Rof (Rho-off)